MSDYLRSLPCLLEDCQGGVVAGNLFSRLSTEGLVKTSNCEKMLASANGAERD